MENEQPLTLNDFEDIDNELKKDSKCIISKRTGYIILGILILLITIIAIIIIILLTNGNNNEDNPDEKALKDKSEIVCNYFIESSLNISILSQEFSVPKFFDIIINNKNIQFNRYYKFDKKGDNEVKFIFYGDFSMDSMFKDIRELTSVNMTTEKEVKILSMKSAFEWCSSLSKFDIKGFNLNNLTSINKIFYGTQISNIDMKERIYHICLPILI